MRRWLDHNNQTVLVPLGYPIRIVVFLFVCEHGWQIALQEGQMDIGEFHSFGLVAH